MNKTFSIEQILTLKQALRNAGFEVKKNVEIESAETFGFRITGTVKLSGKRYGQNVLVSYGAITVDCYTEPKGPTRGGIIVALNRVPGIYTHPGYWTLRSFDAEKIVAAIMDQNKRLERDAEWDVMWEAWVKAKRENHYTDNYKTRFLRKYAREHFPEHHLARMTNKR